MPYNEKTKQYVYEYKANKIKRVPLDMQLSDFEELKQAAAAAGLSVNGFIKAAIKAAIAAAPPVGDSGEANIAGSVSSANFKEKKEKRANVETEHVDVELVEQKTGRKKKLKAPEQFFDAEYCDVREKRTHPLTESIELTEERKEADLNARINSELANQDKQQNARVASDNDFFLK